MSAREILPAGGGNVVAVFVYRFARSRAECSCGWEGWTRMLTGHATLDAYSHVGRCRGCNPMSPLIFDERPAPGRWGRLWRWLTPPVAIAAMPLALIPAGLWVAPLLEVHP